jgi:formate hydrogenlyase transcriptional activator
MKALVHYDWPGNIRELQNVIERAVLLSKGPALTVDVSELKVDNAAKCIQPNLKGLDEMLHDSERNQILRALEEANGIVAGPKGAAARLRINRSTLVSRMTKLGIRASRSFMAYSLGEATRAAASA